MLTLGRQMARAKCRRWGSRETDRMPR
jgi:hypothetical protein